jgi:hypothetical protein
MDTNGKQIEEVRRICEKETPDRETRRSKEAGEREERRRRSHPLLLSMAVLEKFNTRDFT